MARHLYKKDKKKGPGIAKKQIFEDSTTGSSQITQGQPDAENNPGKYMDYDKAKGIKKEDKASKKTPSAKSAKDKKTDESGSKRKAA